MILTAFRLVILVPLTIVAANARDLAPPPPPLPEVVFTAEQIDALITELDADEFAVRQHATRMLVKAGRPAIPALQAASKSRSLEVSVRALVILERVYVRADAAQDPELVDTAEVVIEQLATSGPPSVAGRAVRVLKNHRSIQHRWAISHIERLGGIVRRTADSTEDFQGRARVATGEIEFVIIGRNWEGGDGGLRHVAAGLKSLDLSRLRRIPTLYVINGCGVSADGLEALEKQVPNFPIQRRGQAHLGVHMSSRNHPKGCQIQEVNPNTAASMAGIRPNDVIMQFAGDQVADSDALIAAIAKANAGQVVKVTVLREEQKRLALQLAGGAKHGIKFADRGPQLGCLVDSVAKDSPGAEAGLKEGDHLRYVNGQQVYQPKIFQRMIERIPDDKRAELIVSRYDQQIIELDVTLGDWEKVHFGK